MRLKIFWNRFNIYILQKPCDRKFVWNGNYQLSQVSVLESDIWQLDKIIQVYDLFMKRNAVKIFTVFVYYINIKMLYQTSPVLY